MITRIWWKDARQFAPIWLALAAAAALAQWLALRYGEPAAVRSGLLGAFAAGWVWLYALTVGAAALAGERESNTLGLLDRLGASRALVWRGKASFALVSAAALALALLALAAANTDAWGSNEAAEHNARLLGMMLGVVAVGALAWGLFWSAIARTALSAAVLAVLSAVLVDLVLLTIVLGSRSTDINWPLLAGLRLLVALAMTLYSLRRFSRLDRGFRNPEERRFRLRSPIERLPLAGEPARVEAVGPPGRWSALGAVRSLGWQRIREGFAAWLGLALIGLGIPFVLAIGWGAFEPSFVSILNLIVALTVGIGTFHAESRDRTNRFLAHHGVRPSTAWAVKVAVGAAAVALIWVLLPIPLSISWRLRPEGNEALQSQFVFLIGALPLGFAVGTLCGMAVRRGVTAAMVAVLVTLLIGTGEAALVTGRMMPIWGLLLPPIAALLVSWAWSGDWLLDRPAPGRWVRLGCWTASAALVLFGLYVSYRVYSIPATPPIEPPTSWRVAAIPPDPSRDASTLYREAIARVEEGTERSATAMVDEALALARRAATLPEYRAERTVRPTNLMESKDSPLRNLTYPLRNDLATRVKRGDLAGGWDDILTLFRIARHDAASGAVGEADLALLIECDTLVVAFDWAAESGQTPELLRKALAEYRSLPPYPPLAEVFREEARRVEAALDHPDLGLHEWLETRILDRSGDNVGVQRVGLDLATTPWELARTRRAARLYFHQIVDQSMRDPWQRPAPAPWVDSMEMARQRILETTPLARWLLPATDELIARSDRAESARRVFGLFLALRIWQLEHDDTYPDTLEALGPELLGPMPIDPFIGRPFRYATAHVGWFQSVPQNLLMRGTEYSPPHSHGPRHAILGYAPARAGWPNAVVFLLPMTKAEAEAEEQRKRSLPTPEGMMDLPGMGMMGGVFEPPAPTPP